MKSVFMSLVSALVLVLSAQSVFALGDDSEVCVKHMTCGTFEGTGSWYDANNKPIRDGYKEKFVITPLNSKSVNLKVYIYKNEATVPWTDSNIEFKTSGQFKIVDNKGVTHATGFCRKKVCTVVFPPAHIQEDGKDYMNAFVNTLRFEGDKLKRYNMVSNSSNDAELMFQRSEMTKK